ncbi:hypothetical protein WDW37_09635 [Bdellovibrionota bacterium FG-1]
MKSTANFKALSIVPHPKLKPVRMTRGSYFELRVPMNGKTTHFDVQGNPYSKWEEKMLRSKACFKANFAVTKYMELLALRDLKTERP